MAPCSSTLAGRSTPQGPHIQPLSQTWRRCLLLSENIQNNNRMTLDCLLQNIQLNRWLCFIIHQFASYFFPKSSFCRLSVTMEFPNKLSGGHYHGTPQLSKTGQNAVFPKLSRSGKSHPVFPKLLKTVWTLSPLWPHAHRMDGCGWGWGWCLTCHRMAWVLLASISDCNVEQKKPSTGSRTTLKLYICKHTMYNIEILLKWLPHNAKNCTYADTTRTTLLDISEVTAT